MSSLPPFNPTGEDRLVWMLHIEGAAGLLATSTLPGLGRCWLDRAVSVEVEAAVAGAITASVRAGDGNALLVARPALLEGVLRTLLELPPGHGTLVFIPGALTTVQLLRRRAMLRHLNQGAAA